MWSTRCFEKVLVLRPGGLSGFSWTRLGRGYLDGVLITMSSSGEQEVGEITGNDGMDIGRNVCRIQGFY